MFESPLDQPGRGRESNEYTGSYENPRRAALWLKLCLETHGLCTHTSEACTRISRTRISRQALHVGSEVTGQHPRVCEANGEVGQCATLSHRCSGPNVLHGPATLKTIDALSETASPSLRCPKRT